MSILARSTFYDDGYSDGFNGSVPRPPDAHNGSHVLASEYMAGWHAGNIAARHEDMFDNELDLTRMSCNIEKATGEA